MATERADVLVVGAGPAGLACVDQLLATAANLRITVLDAGAAPGGQYWRHPAPSDGDGAVTAADIADLHHDVATYRRLNGSLVDALEQVTTLLHHHVWSIVKEGEHFAAHAVDRSGRPGDERQVCIRARAVVLATGAFDRALPFPGWDLPGVMTAGGLQALLKGSGVAAGSRVVVAGTGPFLLPVAAGLAAHGATVAAVIEANSPSRWLRHLPAVAANITKLGEGAAYARSLLRHRVPVRARSIVVAAHGTERVEAVTVAKLDRSGRVRSGSERRIACDALGIGWGFTPQLDLAATLALDLTTDASGTPVVTVDRLQRTSRERVYAAGEACGVGGAALAVTEGRLVAHGVLADLAGTDIHAKSLTLEVLARRLRRFAAAMHMSHPVPAGWADLLTDGTTICRCEEVSAGTVRTAVVMGATDTRQVKQLTRAGMGWCQGRVCGYAVDLLTGGCPAPPPERLVATPLPLRVLADPLVPCNIALQHHHFGRLRR